jgi:hypothetical protein
MTVKKLALATGLAIALSGFSSLAQAKGSRSESYKSYNSTSKEHNVSGYTRKDGIYVAPHSRSNRDGARNNNWTTQGNTNPHTGKDGAIPRSYYEKTK